MKTRHLFFKTVMISTLALVSTQTLNSCKKEDPEPTMAEVIDTAPADNLKSSLTQATTLSALPAEIKTAASSITTILPAAKVETYSSVDLNPVVVFFQTNITLSGDEVTKLKANDPYTYNDVINRMSKMPPFTSSSEVATLKTGIEANTQLSSFALKVNGSTDNLYASDYYQGALDLQKFITDYTIPMIQKIAALKATGTKSASLIMQPTFTDDEKKQIAIMLGLTLTQLKTYTDVYIAELIAQHEGGTTN